MALLERHCKVNSFNPMAAQYFFSGSDMLNMKTASLENSYAGKYKFPHTGEEAIHGPYWPWAANRREWAHLQTCTGAEYRSWKAEKGWIDIYITLNNDKCCFHERDQAILYVRG